MRVTGYTFVLAAFIVAIGVVVVVVVAFVPLRTIAACGGSTALLFVGAALAMSLSIFISQ